MQQNFTLSCNPDVKNKYRVHALPYQWAASICIQGTGPYVIDVLSESLVVGTICLMKPFFFPRKQYFSLCTFRFGKIFGKGGIVGVLSKA